MAGFTHPSRPTQKLSGDFWKFWLGQTISNLGSSFTGFALPLIVFKLTGSAVNLAISSATLSLFFGFAQVTAVASLVTQEDLVTANGRIQASYSAVSAIGPLLAGLLVATVPLPALLLLDALSFLLSAGSLALLRTSFNPSGSPP